MRQQDARIMWASTCSSVTLSLCPDVQTLVALLFGSVSNLCHCQGLYTVPYIIAWYAPPEKWNHTSQWCRSWLWAVCLFSMHFQSISWSLTKKKKIWINSSSYWPKGTAEPYKDQQVAQGSTCINLYVSKHTTQLQTWSLDTSINPPSVLVTLVNQ